MIIEKNNNGIFSSRYKCDMCRKTLNKEQRLLVSTSELGKDKTIKKWDLCENCMKIIEKNVKIWYDKVINKE